MSERTAGPEIQRLIQLLARLPGLVRGRARRAALHLIRKREELLAPLADALHVAHEKIAVCSSCGNIDTLDPCTVCRDERRDAGVIVVVETVADLWALERAAAIRARYHVLAARCRLLMELDPRISISLRSSNGDDGWRPRNHSCRQCHCRWPDDGALHHGSPGASAVKVTASRMACRSAVNSIISMKARSRPRSGSARRFSPLIAAGRQTFVIPPIVDHSTVAWSR